MKLNTGSFALAAGCGTLLYISSIQQSSHHAYAFTPSSSRVSVRPNIPGRVFRVLSLSSSNEESLRDELKQKSTLVDAKDEILYGSGVSGLIVTPTNAEDNDNTDKEKENAIETETVLTATAAVSSSTDTTTKTTSTMDKQKLNRILKPRAYPLFLAEKAALITEDIIDSIFDTNGKNRDLSAYELYQQKESGTSKEKIVILGTGWGSAAFLKDIDTNMYDVTVISPRNFFLFTPM